MMKEIEKGIENVFDTFDFVNVIRCKHCKYRRYYGYCTKNKRYTGDDAFCSEGIKGRSKEEESMENKDIRTCPFCGGEAKISKNPHTARVVCSKCGATSKTIVAQIDICATDEAKRLWNRRVLDDRHGRPYDAMGDDNGRGETADSRYRESFAKANAYIDALRKQTDEKK